MNHKYDDLEPIYPGLMSRCDAVGDVLLERQHQDEKWGGKEHDDQHEPDDWLGFANNVICEICEHTTDFRTGMVKVAALALAAIESHDRKNS